MHLLRRQLLLVSLLFSACGTPADLDQLDEAPPPTEQQTDNAIINSDGTQAGVAPAPVAPESAPALPPAEPSAPTPSAPTPDAPMVDAPAEEPGIAVVLAPPMQAPSTPSAPEPSFPSAPEPAIPGVPEPSAPEPVVPAQPGDAGVTPSDGDAAVEPPDDGVSPPAPSARVVIPSASATVEVKAALVAEGSGSERVGAIKLHNGVGQIVLEGRSLKALAYAAVDWTEAGYMLYQTLVVGSDRLYVVWLYCVGDQISSLYSEGTLNAPLKWEVASGSCTELASMQPVAVAFPALNMGIPKPIEGFRVAGPHLTVESGRTGKYVMDGKTLTVLPFQIVDCSTCPEDGYDGWYELHALLWDRLGRKLSFGAFYLSPRHAGQIGLDYVIRLPDVTFGQPPHWFAADWSKLPVDKSQAEDPRVTTLSRPLAPLAH